MLDIARKLFQRLPFSEYAKFTSSLREPSTSTSSQIISREIEEYGNFNRELYRQHRDTEQQNYFKRLNRDFDNNTVLRAEFDKKPTYYGLSLSLFLLFDWQLFIGTSTYSAMLLTAGGAAALFYRSFLNTNVLPQITQIRLLENNQLDVEVHNQANVRVPLSNFSLRNRDEGDGLGRRVEGFIANIDGKYYRINENARLNRSLFEKILQ